MKGLTLAQRLQIPKPQLLQILDLGSKQDFHLSVPLPSNPFISKRTRDYLIPSLRITAARNNLSSLSSSQVSDSSPVLVVHKRLIPGQWENYSAQPDDYKVYLNPQFTSVNKGEENIDEDWERCPSIPEVEALCRRYKRLRFKYQNITEQWCEEEVEGFEARVLHHEIDHLKGKIMTNAEVSLGRMRSGNEWVQKAIDLIETEILNRKKKLMELFGENKTVKEKVAEARVTEDVAFRAMVMTEKLAEWVNKMIGNAFWARELDESKLEDEEFEGFLKRIENTKAKEIDFAQIRKRAISSG
jgi:peptide deformylase